MLLLHGLFGALSNFATIIDHFAGKINVVVPMLPIFELPLRKLSVMGLVNHVDEGQEEGNEQHEDGDADNDGDIDINA